MKPTKSFLTLLLVGAVGWLIFGYSVASANDDPRRPPVVLCHAAGTPGQVELTFPGAGWVEHIQHGDKKGPCPTPPPTTQPEVSTTTEPPETSTTSPATTSSTTAPTTTTAPSSSTPSSTVETTPSTTVPTTTAPETTSTSPEPTNPECEGICTPATVVGQEPDPRGCILPNGTLLPEGTYTVIPDGPIMPGDDTTGTENFGASRSCGATVFVPPPPREPDTLEPTPEPQPTMSAPTPPASPVQLPSTGAAETLGMLGAGLGALTWGIALVLASRRPETA